MRPKNVTPVSFRKTRIFSFMRFSPLKHAFCTRIFKWSPPQFSRQKGASKNRDCQGILLNYRHFLNKNGGREGKDVFFVHRPKICVYFLTIFRHFGHHPKICVYFLTIFRHFGHRPKRLRIFFLTINEFFVYHLRICVIRCHFFDK